MSTAKETIAKQMKGTGLASQEALVKRLIRKTVQPVKHTIPGGKSLFDVVDKTNIADTVYTWLRRVTQFSDVKISLAGNPALMNLTKRKVEDLESSKNGPIWWDKNFGKRKLAEIMGSIMFEHECVVIEATKDGVWIYEDATKKFDDTSPDFEPYIEFTPTSRTKEEYRE